MTDEEYKAEYETYVAPDIGAIKKRIGEAMVRGTENAKIKAAQKKRYIEAKQRWNRRREISDTFGI